MENIKTPTPQNWLQANAQKLIALTFWLALLIGYQWYATANALSPLQVAQRLVVFMQIGFWGPLVYIALYAVRPLILFPSTVLTLAGGFVFGPILGVLYTLVASNTSATIAYLIGRYFGQGLLKDNDSDSWIQRYARRMQAHSFDTVMVMRFIFLPYDAVSYLSGLLRIHYPPFILATALGSIPGTIAFVGFGASIEHFDGGLPALNPVTLAFSVGIFIVSILLSRLFKRRESQTSKGIDR